MTLQSTQTCLHTICYRHVTCSMSLPLQRGALDWNDIRREWLDNEYVKATFSTNIRKIHKQKFLFKRCLKATTLYFYVLLYLYWNIFTRAQNRAEFLKCLLTKTEIRRFRGFSSYLNKKYVVVYLRILYKLHPPTANIL